MTTPRRSFCPDPELWAAVKETASRRGETPSDIIVRALERYVHSHLPPKGLEPAPAPPVLHSPRRW